MDFVCTWLLIRITPWFQFLSTLMLVLAANHKATAASSGGGIGNETVLHYPLLEELNSRTVVGNIVLDYGLDRKYPEATLNRLRFSFLTLPVPRNKQYFSVDELGGVLRTTQKIDREEICLFRSDDPCYIKFDVAVQPIQFFQIIKVHVEIIDMNDNDPFFRQESLTFEVSEAADPRTSFFIPSAEDKDSSKNGVSQYEIVPATDKFELLLRSRPDGSLQVRLALKDRLDRESVDFYRFEVHALDGGYPTRTGSIEVLIEVLDANDNSPTFESSSYEARVPEDTATGSVVWKAEATDRDVGLNAVIIYDFTRETQLESGHLFGITPDSGQVYTKAELDFESKAAHLLYVTASDCGPGESLSSQVLVIVNVIDVNDNQPRIRVNTVGGSERRHAEVIEGSDLGSFVAHVTVEDLDSGSNGRFHCTIADSQLFDLKQMYPTEFKVVTLVPFDREVRETYDFSVTCSDNGIPALTSAVPVRVIVVDRNDHAPRFSRDAYELSIEENNPPGVTLTAVKATDQDSGPNSDIVYRLDDSALGIVSVNSSSGILEATISFDRELSPEYQFEVTASDCGVPPKIAKIYFRLKVLDVDDEGPVFQRNQYVFDVEENQPNGTEVGCVTATDRDQRPFNEISYGLISSDTDQQLSFRIDAQTGRLTTTAILDCERQSSFRLIASAVSTLRGVPVTVSASVEIQVADVNDHLPLFEFPSASSSFSSSADDDDDIDHGDIVISNSLSRGDLVVRLRARDLDRGHGSKLIFAIAAGNDAQLFTVDPETGDLRVNGDLTGVDGEEIPLRVTVTDGGEPSLSDSRVLRIAIRKQRLSAQASHMYRILASEDLAIVLAGTLVAILLAIGTVVAIICSVRKRRRMKGRKATRRSVALELNPGQRNGGSESSKCGSRTTGALQPTIKDVEEQKNSGSRRPVVAFVRHPQQSESSCLDNNNSDSSTSDSGRGPSSEDGDPHQPGISVAKQPYRQGTRDVDAANAGATDTQLTICRDADEMDGRSWTPRGRQCRNNHCSGEQMRQNEWSRQQNTVAVNSGSALTLSSTSAAIPEVETLQSLSPDGDLHLSTGATPDANAREHSPFVHFSLTTDVFKDRLTGCKRLNDTDILKDRLSLRGNLSAPYRRDSNFYIQMVHGFGNSPAVPSGFVSSIQTLESGVRRGLRIDRKGFVRAFGFRRYPTVLPDLDPALGRRPRRSFDPVVQRDVFPDLVPVSRSALPTRSQSTSSLQDVENGNEAGDTPPGDDVVRTYEDVIRNLLPYPPLPSFASSSSPPPSPVPVPSSVPSLSCSGEAMPQFAVSSDIYGRITEKRKMTSPEDALVTHDAMDTAV